jgi:hypothetical protein
MPKNEHQKRTEAEERASHRNKMSHKDQIARLDSLFGKDLGAAKERARLSGLLSAKLENSEERPKKSKKKQEEV